MPDETGTPQWYDALYTAKPNKWASEVRNEFCRTTVQGALGKAPMNVLDIGCGIGHTIEHLAQWWPESETQFTGIDLSPVAVKICKKKLPKALFFCGAFGETDGLGQYDCVISLGVFEHIQDTPQLLEDLKVHIAPGGIVYVEVPNCIAYSESKHSEGFRRLTVGNHQMEWHRRRKTWEKLLTAAGYEFESFNGPTIQTQFVWILRLP